MVVVRQFFSPSRLLILLLVVGFLLRVIALGSYPSGLQGDEASFLLNAKTLKTNLHDEDNRFLPLYLNSFIDPKPALYSYLQIPFISIFGVTTTAARLPAAILGTVSLYLVYVFLRFFLKTNLSVLITALLTISPWHILLSRGSQEVIMSFTFAMAALIFLLHVLREKRFSLVRYVFFLFLALLAMYSYHSAKVFLPLIVLTILISELSVNKFDRFRVGSIVIGTVVVTAVATVLSGLTRASAVSLFSDPHTQLVLDEKIRTAAMVLPLAIIRLFVNKPFDYALALLHNFGQYFTFDFLFLSGGQPERFIIPFHGVLYGIESVFLLYGVFVAFAKEKRQALFFMIWLVAAVLPGVVTSQEVPSVIRTFPLIIPLYYFIGVGLLTFWRNMRKGKLSVFRYGVIGLYLLSFAYFVFAFLIYQPYYHPWYRDTENQKLPEVVKTYEGKYKYFSISTNQYAYFTLSGMIPVEELQKSYPRRLQKTDTFGNLTFHRDDCVLTSQKETLSFMKGSCTIDEGKLKASGYTQIGRVAFKDNATAYRIFSYQPNSLAQ